jgi:hypothetical protein
VQLPQVLKKHLRIRFQIIYCDLHVLCSEHFKELRNLVLPVLYLLGKVSDASIDDLLSDLWCRSILKYAEIVVRLWIRDVVR